MIRLHVHYQLSKDTPMSQHTAYRRHQAIKHDLAADKVEDLCRHLACAKVGSPRGGVALMPTIPPGPRTDPKDPRATRPTPRKASNGPSCLST